MLEYKYNANKKISKRMNFEKNLVKNKMDKMKIWKFFSKSKKMGRQSNASFAFS